MDSGLACRLSRRFNPVRDNDTIKRRRGGEEAVIRNVATLGEIRKDLEMNKLDSQVKCGKQNEIAANKRVNGFQYFSHNLCAPVCLELDWMEWDGKE